MVRMEGLRLASPARAAVVGLGNPYRGDDGVGPALLNALRAVTRNPSSVTGNSELHPGSRDVVHGSRITVHGSRLTAHGSRITVHGSRITDYDLIEAVHGGFRLAEAVCGYERVLIVDAAPWLPPGEVARFPLEDLPSRAGYLHGLGLRVALEALAMAGERVPEVEVLAVGIPGDPQFGEGLSEEVERALPRALAEVSEWLNGC